jgi:hypothetical protein
MKHLFLFVLIAASAMSVSAQKVYRDNDRHEQYHYKNDRDDRNKMYDQNGNERRAFEARRQVEVINRNYDARINSIRRDPYMRNRVKERKIRKLESERRIALEKWNSNMSARREKDRRW